MKNKLKKEDKILFLIILAVTALLGNAFLRTHFSSDTYVLIKLGYFEYPSQYFLLDGRLISTLACYIAGIYKIPYNIYLIGMDCIGVVLLSASIFILHKKLIEIIGTDDKLHQLLILFATYVMIFNQFTLEYLLFPESAVMCFAVLCTILASIQTIQNNKHKFLKAFIYEFLVVISYQSLILAFPVMVLFLQFLNMKNLTPKKRRKVFLELINYAIITIIVLLLEYKLAVIMNKYFREKMTRTVRIGNIEGFVRRLKYALYNVVMLFTNYMNMLPQWSYIVCLIIPLFIMIIKKEPIKNVLQCLILIFVAFCECTMFMFWFDSGQCARTNWEMSILWGIELIYLLLNFDKTKRTGKIITFFIVISFIFNAFMLLENSSYHIAANAVDRNDGYIIKKVLDKYEATTGQKVTKIAYIYDFEPSQYSLGIKKMGSLSERALSCGWCIVEAVSYYTGRDLKEIDFPYITCIKEMKAINYSGFSEDELYINGDTLYMVVY